MALETTCVLCLTVLPAKAVQVLCPKSPTICFELTAFDCLLKQHSEAIAICAAGAIICCLNNKLLFYPLQLNHKIKCVEFQIHFRSVALLFRSISLALRLVAIHQYFCFSAQATLSHLPSLLTV